MIGKEEVINAVYSHDGPLRMRVHPSAERLASAILSEGAVVITLPSGEHAMVPDPRLVAVQIVVDPQMSPGDWVVEMNPNP